MGKDSYLYKGFAQDAVSVWATQDEFSSCCFFFFLGSGPTWEEWEMSVIEAH